MSRRADHLAEMRFALAQGCSLDEARRRLSWTAFRARKEAFEKRMNVPAFDRPLHHPSDGPQLAEWPAPGRPLIHAPSGADFWWNRD